MAKYDDIDFNPPKSVQDNARRGLELRREFGRGGTAVGIARARTLSNGQSISPETVGRMVSYFARHEVDKKPDWANPSNPTNGYIAWQLWGGDAGRAWAGKLQRQMEARDKARLRKLFLITTNNRIDRDGEIVSLKALEDYVSRAHDENGLYIGNNPLLMWHDGEPIGRIIGCELVHGFLIEIAEELPNSAVNVGTGNEPIATTIKACWDMIEDKQAELGVSQGFKFLDEDLEGNVYRRIYKTESSVLPIEDASNPFTFVKVLNI